MIAAYIFLALTAIAVTFLFALASGAPWGEMAMGGKYPGRLTSGLRVACVLQMILLSLIALIVLTRAGLMFSEYFSASKSAIWAIVVFFTIGTFLNTITPSKKERLLWAPVNLGLLVCAVVVAVSGA